MGKENSNNIEIDIVKSYQYLKKEKIKDFYGINKNEIDPFADWLLKEIFRDVFLIKYSIYFNLYRISLLSKACIITQISEFRCPPLSRVLRNKKI